MAVAETVRGGETYRFSVADLQRMGEVGILGEDDRVELIDGVVVRMSAAGARHVRAVTVITTSFGRQLPEGLLLSVQSPILVARDGAPEPDLAVHRVGDFAKAYPGPSDILLVVEVAETSRAYDSGTKLPLYARSGIPEAWLVDLGGVIERHMAPSPSGYLQVARFPRGSTVTSTAIPALSLAVDAVLG